MCVLESKEVIPEDIVGGGWNVFPKSIFLAIVSILSCHDFVMAPLAT